MEKQTNSWVIRPLQRPEAKLRLFCFPYAGGGTSTYYPWVHEIAPEIEICLLQLPGRERRLDERPFTALQPLVQNLAEALQPCLNKPFAFFGHSMGALISFELACHLCQNYALLPQHLFVSAYRAPHLSDRRPPIHHLPDKELVERLRKFNGTPEIALQNEEFMALFLPIIRADFTLCETYRCPPHAPLACSISALGGRQDELVNRDELEHWRTWTTGTFTLSTFPGDHFYLQKEQTAVLSHITEHLLD